MLVSMVMIHCNMAKRIAAVKARQALGALLDDVKLTGAEYVIERDGRPTAFVVSVEAYQRYQHGRGEAFDRIEALRERLGRTAAADDLEALIDEAAREVRG